MILKKARSGSPPTLQAYDDAAGAFSAASAIFCFLFSWRKHSNPGTT